VFREIIQTKINNYIKEQAQLSAIKGSSEQPPVKEGRVNVLERVFNLVVQEHLDQWMTLQNFKLFWTQPWASIITLKVTTTFQHYQFLTGLFQQITDFLAEKKIIVQEEDFFKYERGEFELKDVQLPFEILLLNVPKNYMRKVVGYQEARLNIYRQSHRVDFFFNKDVFSDEVFPMNDTTPLRIFGRSSDVMEVAKQISKEMERLKMQITLVQSVDCKKVMDNVKDIKTMIDPCELRVKKPIKEWRDIRHPFYYIPNFFREIALIGTEAEIERGEQFLDRYLNERRGQKLESLSFLLPKDLKGLLLNLKKPIIVRHPEIQIYFYDPSYPRKHLTIQLIGPWNVITKTMNDISQEASKYMVKQPPFIDFERFQY